MKLVFFILAFVIGVCHSWKFANYISFKDSCVQCKASQCNISLSITADGYAWAPILIMVEMGHTEKVDDGKLAIYDVNEHTLVPRIYGNKNKFAGSIQDFGTRKQKSLFCKTGSSCAIEMCIKRGRSTITKNYNNDGTEKDTWITWSPLITFTELWFGPRFVFKYHIKNGVKSRLEVEPTVHYWSECHLEAYDDSYYYPYALVPKYL